MNIYEHDDLSVENIDLHKIYENIPNRFLLSVAVAKRSKQLKDGVKPLIPTTAHNSDAFISIALKEIMEKKVRVISDVSESDDESILSEMDQFLDAEIEESASDDTDKKGKDPKKPKSKSLAA